MREAGILYVGIRTEEASDYGVVQSAIRVDNLQFGVVLVATHTALRRRGSLRRHATFFFTEKKPLAKIENYKRSVSFIWNYILKL